MQKSIDSYGTLHTRWARRQGGKRARRSDAVARALCTASNGGDTSNRNL